jgi:hypothetical protein
MSFEDFRNQSQQARQNAEQVREQLKKDRQALGNTQRKRKQFSRNLSASDAPQNDTLIQLDQNERDLSGRVSAGKANYAQSLAEELDSLKHFVDFTNPLENLSNLGDDTPILLFPLRLETRFKKVTRDNRDIDQLWVRVFPDDIAIDSFESDLSSAEISNLRRYWCHRWAAGKNEQGNRAAWRTLASSHGPGRAYWLTQQFKPDNIAQEPEKEDGEVILVVAVDTLPSSTDITLLQRYWSAVWSANQDNATLTSAWDTLVSDAGGQQSAETLVEQYVPTNLNESPPAGFDHASTSVKVEFLDLPVAEDIETKIHAWSQPPRTTILPERFVLLCYRDGELDMDPQLSKLIPPQLILGPDPSAEEGEELRLATREDAEADPDVDEGDLIFSENMRWMFDFDEAVDKGMGFRVDLNADQANTGFDRVLVLGVKLSADETDGKEKLESLFENHHHSRKGMGILKQGTPTNNTEDDNSSYSWRHNANESFDQYFLQTESESEETDWFARNDGQWLVDMLGLDPDKLRHIDNFSQPDISEGLAMQRALWPATMGHFMQSMMNPVFSDKTIEETRQFFQRYVSGRGCLPAIRVGNQPYGIFPATNFNQMRWFLPGEAGTIDVTSADVTSARTGFDQRYGASRLSTGFLSYLYSILMDLDGVWKRKLDDVSYVGKTGDPHQILLDVVGLHPTSKDLYKRYANSINQIWNMYLIGGNYYPQLSSLLDAYREQTQLLSRLGYPTGLENPAPKIFEKVFFEKPWVLYGDRVDKVPNSEQSAISDYTDDGRNYIEWLIDAAEQSHNVLRQQQGFTDNVRPNTLLYLLMYHALDLSYVDTSLKLKLKAGVLNQNDYKTAFVEPEFIQIQQGKEHESRWKHLYQAEPGITGDQSLMLADYIGLNLNQIDEAAAFRDAISGMRRLSDTSTASLERLLLEHIDTVSYRHDAWLGGFTSLQLELMRQQTSDNHNDESESRQGLYLGAYGWLEDLRPENKVLTKPTLNDEQEDIFNKANDLQEDSENAGYILTPSQNHAVTAAILRNGNVFFEKQEQREQLNIKLTSERVREALSVIEGMQSGQSLAALLGYRFERGLHDRTDAEVDQFILDIRNEFPLVAKKIRETTPPPGDPDYDSIEQIEARNVLDGVAFLEHVTGTDELTYPFGLDLPSASAAQQAAINNEVAHLMDLRDAIADLAMAESVHQVVMGNYERASAVLDTYSKGNFPPTPDVIKTPRSGPVLTHRVGLQFQTGLSHNINDPGVSPRMVAEPAMHDWLASVLPPLNQIVLILNYVDGTTGNPTAAEISLHTLGLSAIDLLYLVDVSSEQAMSTLDDLVTQHALDDPGIDLQLTHPIEIEYAGKTNADHFSIFEVNALLDSLRELLLHSRYLKPTDVRLPNESGTQQAVNMSLPESRVTSVMTELDQLNTSTLQNHIDHLSALIAAENTSDMMDQILVLMAETRHLMTTVSRYGLLQTGIGFVYQWHQQMVIKLAEKVQEIHQRWQGKLDRYAALLADYSAMPVADTDARFRVLQKMELLVSTQATPVTATPEDFLTDVVAPKHTAYLNKFTNEIVPLLQQSDLKILFQSLNALAITSADFDLVGVELESEINQLLMFVEDLHTGSVNLSGEISRKLTTAQSKLDQLDPAKDTEKNIALVIDAGKAIFGDHFVMVPEFGLSDEHATEWQNALSDSQSLLRYLENDQAMDFPVDHWFYGVSRVREKMHDLENSQFHIEGFGGSELNLTPMQLPYRSQDYWLALQFPKTRDGSEEPFVVDEDKLLYTAVYGESFNPAKNQCGLLLDDWTEMIPSKDETAGLGFHYDQPNSEPPQALLLALPSDFTGSWQWQDLVDILHSTLDAAKQRAIEPDHVDDSEYSLFLPTIVSLASPMPLTATLNLALNNEVYFAAVNTND